MKRLSTGVYQGTFCNGDIYNIVKKGDMWFFAFDNAGGISVRAKKKSDLVNYVVRLDNEIRAELSEAK